MRTSGQLGMAVLAAGALVLSGCTTAAAHHDQQPAWSAAWSSAPQRPSAGFGPNWSEQGFSDQTLRQVVRLTNGGDQVRIRLSNHYGLGPLEVTGSTVAATDTGAAITATTLHPLTFAGTSKVTIPAGAELTSDPAPLHVTQLENVTVTLYLRATTGPATFHSQAWTDSYLATGDHLSDPAAAAFAAHTNSWYYLTDVEVAGPAPRRDTVVAFGDSITDGFASTPRADHRWPDQLADRLVHADRQRAVLDEGIGGNLMLNDSAWYGDRASTRFSHDVLDKPGVRSVILLEGVNDLGFSETDQPTYKPDPDVSAAQVITGYQNLITQAHNKGIRIIGATLLPFGGSDHYSARSATKRHAINEWIRTSGQFDAVVDFAAAVTDATNPEILAPAYDSGDHLHPNDAGYHAMAEAINIATL
ncbi:SGNH/GDSL hydrolase family protein [Nocardia sp. NPDC088792]|uniref:SGNH/GDSL hydrolase family protein n=1 Tax=Nocardia sp. NPDC088792 TaxID=3364332 RepID=UPI0037FE6CAA